ncbi:hypothetical protein [Flammeovirga sp. OC4]|uniref:hypothetical protein n=1 Tax=Flammeovirga sp. OC4 TaxID=1382345 RepID=UPI0012E090FF|nr:hypothetical protein [Flammeovirga sp. OC4]
MTKKKVIIFNVLLIGLFHILRVTIMNWIFLFELLLLVEVFVVFILLLRLISKKYRVYKNMKMTVVHVLLIVSMFLIIGDYLSVGYLNIYHRKTIQIFEKYNTIIPVAERVSGSWIIEDKSFKEVLSEDEYLNLQNNFKKSSPCQYENGYCYIEFGGFLKNIGGYYFDIAKRDVEPSGFGFTRIKKTKTLTENWGIYNR